MKEGTAVVSRDIYPAKDGWQIFSVIGQTVSALGFAS